MNFGFVLCLLSFTLACVPQALVLDGPIFILVAGQSNAVGTGNSAESLTGQINCFEYNSKLNDIVPLQDPVGQVDLGFEQAVTGSLSPSLAFNLSKLTNPKILIVQCAKGGSALHPLAEQNNWGIWDESGSLLSNSFKKIDKALSKTTVPPNNKLNTIILSQGESDGIAIGNGIITRSEYKSSLQKLISNYRNKYSEELPFIIIETCSHLSCGICDTGFEIVRQVQREVADEDIFTFIGFNETEYFEERNWLLDPLHYNQTALNHIGETLANFLVSSQIDIY